MNQAEDQSSVEHCSKRKRSKFTTFRPIPNTISSEVIRIGDYRTVLGVPLLREGIPIGVFGLNCCAVRPFTAKQIELVSTFADQAVIAIENVRLFDEVQAKTRDFEESLQQQTATSEVLQIISSSPGDLAPVFDKMLENATRVCGASFGTMNLGMGRSTISLRATTFRPRSQISGYGRRFVRIPAQRSKRWYRPTSLPRLMTSGRPQRTVPAFPTWSRWRRSPAPGRFWSCPC